MPLGAVPAPVATAASGVDDGPSLPLLVGAAAATLGALVAAVLLFQHSNRLRAALARVVPRVGRGAQVRDGERPNVLSRTKRASVQHSAAHDTGLVAEAGGTRCADDSRERDALSRAKGAPLG